MIERLRPLLPFAIIFVLITLTSLPALRSGEKIMLDADFFQYVSRHEAVKKSVLEYHTLPLRSHWFSGGYPTIGDPEDPTFNPLVLSSIVLGPVKGLKLIAYIALLIGGLATYALARYILGYTVWGALFSGLVFGICPFVPLRMANGNPNEVYAAFLPLCLLLIGLACRGRRIALVILPFVFLTMLSDGKLTALMAMFYCGVVCVAAMIVPLRALSPAGSDTPLPRVDYRPLRLFLVAMGLTALLGMARILPALELTRSHGGVSHMISAHPKSYQPEGVYAYSRGGLVKEALGLGGRFGLTTVGWIPVGLTAIALVAFWRQALPWGVSLALFGWLILAYHAPVDLLKLLWKLPVFEAIYRPYKYFSFEIAFSFAIAAGQCFSLLTPLRRRWLEGLIATVPIVLSVGFLFPRVESIQRKTYTHDPLAIERVNDDGFFSVAGSGLPRERFKPPRALTYLNLRRNIGTIDWYTGIPIPEYAVPKYFVDSNNSYVPNPEYRGEAFVVETSSGHVSPAGSTFRPNSMAIDVSVKAPGVVVINQNYHRDWHADHGTLIDHHGLLGLQLEDPGVYTIHLRYHPRSFYVGLAVTISSLIALACVCWAYRSGRLDAWSQHAPPVVKKASQAAQWLIA